MSLINNAEAWYACPNNDYELQIRGDRPHAQCVRPRTQVDNATVKNCPQVQTLWGAVGSGFQRDYYRGGADACVTQDPTGTARTAVPHNFCPNGGRYTPIQRRNDVCRVITPRDITDVSRNVN